VKQREAVSDQEPLRADTIFDIVEEEDKGESKEMSATMLDVMKRLCEQMSEDEKVSCGGLSKLVKFCELALQYDCKYVWFDTGCINKESSTELEESI
jgi:hypothetical protein